MLGVRRERIPRAGSEGDVEGRDGRGGEYDNDGSGEAEGALASGLPAKGLRLESVRRWESFCVGCMMSIFVLDAGVRVLSARRRLPTFGAGGGREPEGRAGGGFLSSVR